MQGSRRVTLNGEQGLFITQSAVKFFKLTVSTIPHEILVKQLNALLNIKGEVDVFVSNDKSNDRRNLE